MKIFFLDNCLTLLDDLIPIYYVIFWKDNYMDSLANLLNDVKQFNNNKMILII